MVTVYRVVLGCEEASSKDEGMLLDTGCTLHSKGERLLSDIAVIPDTTMYATNTESIVLDLYYIGSEDKQKEHSTILAHNRTTQTTRGDSENKKHI
jgi:hypothetical protein